MHKPIIKNFWHYEWHFVKENNETFPGRSKRDFLIYRHNVESWIMKHFRLYSDSIPHGKLSFWHYVSFIPCFVRRLLKINSY